MPGQQLVQMPDGKLQIFSNPGGAPPGELAKKIKDKLSIKLRQKYKPTKKQLTHVRCKGQNMTNSSFKIKRHIGKNSVKNIRILITEVEAKMSMASDGRTDLRIKLMIESFIV